MTTPGQSAVLMIALGHPEHWTDIFGRETMGRGLADLGEAIQAVMGRLLAQHELLASHRQDEDGRWQAYFRLRADGMPRDLPETLGAIEQAARTLVHECLLDVFGQATGRRLPLAVAARTCAPGDPARGAVRPADLAYQSLADLGEVSKGAVELILEQRAVRTLLQPIVRMSDRAVVGYEALSRGPAGSPLERPDRLFDAAQAAGRTVELELLCAALALERTAGRIPAGCFLTINLGPDALARAAEVLPLAGRPEVMFELTEHLPLDEAVGLAAAVARLRALGIGLALDDTGCGFADMDTARILRPNIVKLCITVVRNADKGAPFMRPIQETVSALQALSCRVLAEGVETEAQHQPLAVAGIELAQGWLYGKPADIPG